MVMMMMMMIIIMMIMILTANELAISCKSLAMNFHDDDDDVFQVLIGILQRRIELDKEVI